ncbi:hypothetical protein [Mycoplasmopsis fermentans]|uniref:Transposase n=1 Tax=Mycoplasmopsis fermentans (strain M64) TaxID=943945 RepID=A0AB32XDD3_MYCFM|nr:hypothetical protein [Mycoplasmopsis fermentans]ADV34943.1 Hypothetical Protein MfeM64YM_0948 [Mycoplasmopsis fermentans M64]
MRIQNFKRDKFKSKFVLLNFCEDKNPDLPFFVIEYSQNVFDLASLRSQSI